MGKRDYSGLGREQLEAILHRRDADRSYGLVWERDERIVHDSDINSDFVALEMDSTLSLGDGPYANLLIEGDNYDALRFLNTAYRGGKMHIHRPAL